MARLEPNPVVFEARVDFNVRRISRELELERGVVLREPYEVPCTYSKTYAYPATVVQEDSGGVAQMESRCDNAGEDYVNNQCEAGGLRPHQGYPGLSNKLSI